mgnify:CR=1 FL=1
MKNAGRLLAGLLLLWVGCWLPLGILAGDPTLLLHPLQAPEALRVTYLVLLYGGLLVLLNHLWKGHPPGPILWGSWSSVLMVWLLTLLSTALHRGVLAWGGHWSPQWPASPAWLSALLIAPGLAIVEELVFRGYLFASLRRQQGTWTAALAVSGLFALVHLFRPGSLDFKLAYGLGLFLASLLLILVVLRLGLWPAAAMHSAWITAAVLDPPTQMASHWWSGLRGEPAAGLCSWIFLLLSAGVIWKFFNPRSSGGPHDCLS